MKNPRLLVLRGGAIGDFVMTLPALNALRDRWPGAHIEVLGYTHIADLAVAGGIVNRVMSLDKASVARLFVPEEALPSDLLGYLRGFDVAISYLYDPDESVRASLIKAGVRDVVCGCPQVRDENAALHLFRPLASLAIYPEGIPYPVLRLGPERVAAGRERLRPFGPRVVALHPGSGSPLKNWPLAGYLDVAARVRELGYAALFICGEADEEIRRALARDGVAAILPACSLVELAGVLAACHGYAGNDSGVTHIAAAVGVPTVAIFGPSSQELWGSRAPNVRILCDQGRGSWSGVGATEVFEALAPRLLSGQP